MASGKTYGERKTKGAWIVHHSNKLQAVVGAGEYENLELAGKCGTLLSALSSDNQHSLSMPKVRALAKAARLKIQTDLPTVLTRLSEHGLIDIGQSGIEVLGVTPSVTLVHTADIFETLEPEPHEQACISAAEAVSAIPSLEKELAEKLADEFSLATGDIRDLLEFSSNAALMDRKATGDGEPIYYNGNLFRVNNAKKVETILESLTPVDRTRMREVEDLLAEHGCLICERVERILGPPLFKRLCALGIYDLSSVSNSSEEIDYVTRPGAFGKFGNTIGEDALDLAKAFVASLTYGMQRSVNSRGRIRLLPLLLNKLISGGTLNPSTAAGQDYKVLEYKGVVEVQPVSGSTFTLRLLKKEVGEQALKILTSGDTSEDSLPNFPGSSVTRYRGPEENRAAIKPKLEVDDKKATDRWINDLRTGLV